MFLHDSIERVSSGFGYLTDSRISWCTVMLDPETNAAGLAAGYPSSFAFYFAGRGGVLGDVDADVVHAAFMFFDRALTVKL